MMDYSQRRTVPKNRPKKQPIGLLVPILVVAVLLSFCGGVFTGWLLFRADSALPVDPVAGQGQAPVQEAAKPPVTAVPAPQPLTFYETLSKGNSNALIGSGLNPALPATTVVPNAEAPTPATPSSPQAAAPKPAHPQAPAQVPVRTPVSAPVKEPARAAESGKEPVRTADPAKTPEGKTAAKDETFTVQVGSYKDRKEAEEMLAKTKGNGLPAYIVEARTSDRGTWYRVRIGKKLDHDAAAKLATKAGKGAITVPE